MADLGNMADQLLMAASHLSTPPNPSGSKSKLRRESNSRDDREVYSAQSAGSGLFPPKAEHTAANNGITKRRREGYWRDPSGRNGSAEQHGARDSRPSQLVPYRSDGDNDNAPARRDCYPSGRHHDIERRYVETSVYDQMGHGERSRDGDRNREHNHDDDRNPSSYTRGQDPNVQGISSDRYDRFGNHRHDYEHVEDSGSGGEMNRRRRIGSVGAERGEAWRWSGAMRGGDVSDGPSRAGDWRRGVNHPFPHSHLQPSASSASSSGGGGCDTPIELDNSDDEEEKQQNARSQPPRRQRSPAVSNSKADDNDSVAGGSVTRRPLTSEPQPRPDDQSTVQAPENQSITAFRFNMPVQPLPLSSEAMATTTRLEAAGRRKLGLPSATRRKTAVHQGRDPTALVGCLLGGCELHLVRSSEPQWMARHLATHTLEATKQQNTNDYVRSSVAEALHEMCMDVEVPPAQRKHERRRLASALFGPPERELGFPAGVLETKVLGKVGNPAIRRCAYEVAFGSCEGVGPAEGILRCDTCGSWTHATCGGVAIGGTCEPMVSCLHANPNGTANNHDNRGPAAAGVSARILGVKEEHICRVCARASAPPFGSDGPPGTFSVFAAGRKKRKQMLAFLERDVKMGWPYGVFDLNLDKKESCVTLSYLTLRVKTNNDEQMRVEAQDNRCKRPPCSRGGCTRPSRPDSRYCSDGCGVLNAESQLADALIHTLEEREGRERGQWLREYRLAKKQRSQVASAAKMASKPEIPLLGRRNEERLRLMVDRKWRLWKRLIEIGAYWEKVSGSTNLLAITHEAYANAAAAAAVARQATAASSAARQRGTAAGSSRRLKVRAIHAAAVGSRCRSSGSLPARSGGAGGGAAEPSAPAGVSSPGLINGRTLPPAPRSTPVGDKKAGVVAGVAQAAVSGSGEAEGSDAAKASDYAVAPDATANVAARDKAPAGAREKKADEDGNSVQARAKIAAQDARPSFTCRNANGSSRATDVPNSAGAPSSKAKVQSRTTGLASSSSAAATGGEKEKERDIEVDVGVEDEAAKGTAAGLRVADLGERSGTAEAEKQAVVHNDDDHPVVIESDEQHPQPRQSSSTAPAAPEAVTVPLSQAQREATLRAAAVQGSQVKQAGQREQTALESDAAQLFSNGVGTRSGMEELACPYCGEESGIEVAEHMEECYRQIVALRNARMGSATLRAFDVEANAMLRARSRPLSVYGAGCVTSNTAPVARQLLDRRIAYADFTAMPDQRRFQLHRDLQGWMSSPSRLDFLHKELVRQRNAAIAELQSLDRDEALLERRIRTEWIKEGLRSAASRSSRSTSSSQKKDNNNRSLTSNINKNSNKNHEDKAPPITLA